jgi:hypothetical protein
VNEFSDLSADEIRVLREHRAKVAMASRPPSKANLVLRQLRIIRDAAQALRELDRNDPLASKILDLVPSVVLPD